MGGLREVIFRLIEMGERLSISNLRGPGHSMYRHEDRYFCCFFNELCHEDCLGENIVYTHAEKATTLCVQNEGFDE